MIIILSQPSTGEFYIISNRTKFTIAAIAFVIVIAIGYFKIMTYEEAGGIATLFTSILVLFTLWEMKVQRETIYRPDIILQSMGHFYMFKERNGAVFLPSLWSCKGVDFNPLIIGDNIITEDDKMSVMEFEHLLETSSLEEISIPLFNIGMGAAKNITIEWSSDNNYTINELLKMNTDKEIWPIEKELVWKQRHSNGEMEKNIDYILPIGTESLNLNENQMTIPINIQRFINLFLVVCTDVSGPISELKLPKIPNFFINVNYYDLVNEKHVKKFEVIFTGESWSARENFRNQKIVFNEIKMRFYIQEITV